MPRILHVVENPVESRFLFHLLKELKAARAYESHLLNICEGETFLKQVQSSLASYASFGVRRRYFLKFPVMLRTLRRVKPDIVHAHEFIPAAYAALGLCLLFSKTKLIYHRHHAETRGWKAKLFDAIAAWRADRIITVSGTAADAAKKEHPRYRSKIFCSWNGTVVATTSANSAARLRPQILLLARLRSDKGHEVALRALPQILKRFPNAELIFAGEGPCEQHLKNLALGFEGSIRFLGHVVEVGPLIESCDLLIVPSLAEPFGLVAIEAMALKKLVIASRVGGLAEIIKHRETGVLVEPGDGDALAQEIIRYLEQPEERQRLAFAGHRRYHEEFTTSAMASRLIKTYEVFAPPPV